MASQYDVVVVGAGLAGLRAAELLTRASQHVLVLEARERVGGRTLSVPFADRTIDLGAQWVGPSQRRILTLAQRLGLSKVEQYCRGAALWQLGPRTQRTCELLPAIPLRQMIELAATAARLGWLSRRVQSDAPWQGKHAAAWDERSLDDFLRRHVGGELAHALLASSIRGLFAAEPRDISLLHALFYIRAGAGLRRIASIRRGAQQWYFREGAGELSRRLARELTVHLSEAVHSIASDTSRHVEVYTERARYVCRHVIVAVPPPLTRTIHFSPELPPSRGCIAQATPMGAAIKCVVRYERAFWRQAGLSGEAISDGAVTLVNDAGAFGADGAGGLVAFVLGDHARYYSERPQQRKHAVLEALSRLFGGEAMTPLAYRDQDWCTQPYTQGCYSGLFGRGVLSSSGPALREPVRAIHWAGTETASEHEGYMEGALQSAERVAREILAHGAD